MHSPGRWLRRSALGLLAVYLLIAVPVGVRNTVLRLRVAVKTAGLPAGAMRARVFGPRYVAAVDQIRRAIPVGEPYLLSEAGRPYLLGELDQPAAMLWVRFDLLPRRAMVLHAPGSPGAPVPGDCWLEQIRWIVVAAGPGRPPLLLERPATVPPGCPPAPWMASR
jgi:hypothetical protein